MREYPEDFLAWVNSLGRFKRLSAHRHPNCPFIFTFNSGVNQTGHLPGNPIFSTFMLSPDQVTSSVNWRRLVAGHLRAIRFACRRNAYPQSVLGVKPPVLPWPQ